MRKKIDQMDFYKLKTPVKNGVKRMGQSKP